LSLNGCFLLLVRPAGSSEISRHILSPVPRVAGARNPAGGDLSTSKQLRNSCHKFDRCWNAPRISRQAHRRCARALRVCRVQYSLRFNTSITFPMTYSGSNASATRPDASAYEESGRDAEPRELELPHEAACHDPHWPRHHLPRLASDCACEVGRSAKV